MTYRRFAYLIIASALMAIFISLLTAGNAGIVVASQNNIFDEPTTYYSNGHYVVDGRRECVENAPCEFGADPVEEFYWHDYLHGCYGMTFANGTIRSGCVFNP